MLSAPVTVTSVAASVAAPDVSPVITDTSSEPVMLSVTVCVVPSLAVTVKVSVTLSPASSAIGVGVVGIQDVTPRPSVPTVKLPSAMVADKARVVGVDI